MVGLFEAGLGGEEDEAYDDDLVESDLGLACKGLLLLFMALLLLLLLLLVIVPPKTFSLNSRPSICSCGVDDADNRYLTKSL
jgi:hypothetical protein